MSTLFIAACAENFARLAKNYESVRFSSFCDRWIRSEAQHGFCFSSIFVQEVGSEI